MAGMSPYGALLSQAAAVPQRPPGAMPPAPPPQLPGATPAAGPGAPPTMPNMPGGPPPPTNTGAINTGSKSPKEAASDAILSLRDLKAHFPAMGMQLDGVIEAIKAATQPGGAAQAKGANDGVAPPKGGAAGGDGGTIAAVVDALDSGDDA